MLSSENPPPDLPCSSQTSPLKSITTCCDERNPLPNFSIRDYVSRSRAKGIENNWPFSQKNLQRCLNCGVKDVLPPFDEALNSATTKKTLSAVECGAEILSCSNEKDRHLAPTVKKCRLSVKLNSASEQTPNQDLISEIMAAAKVCPVCKTFSSSSNTTLNAHIDQCLSRESTAKWTATTSSKVTKHRVKLRKTRLMVDIYRTALDCTLEDLDRRNGTNWASNLECPGQDSEACSPVNVNVHVNEDINEGDAYVFIDSNGTKVRGLSKLGDLPSGSDGGYDCGTSKVVGRDKGNDILQSKKKNNLVRKQKLLNHCLYEQKKSHPGPKVNAWQQNKPEVSVDVTQAPIACDQMTSDINSGAIRQWVGSKRTGLREDISHGHESQHLDKLKTKSRIKSNVSSLGDTHVVKSFGATKSDKSPHLVAESHKRIRPRKNSLSKAQDCRDRNDCLELNSKFNVEGSRNHSSSVDHEHHVDPSNGVENHVSALEKDSSSSRLYMPTQHHTFSSESKKFTSSGKRLLGRAIPSICKNFASLRKKLSVRHASISEPKKKMRRKHLDFKKRRMRCISGSEEEAVEAHRENESQMEHATSKSLIINKAKILETQKKRGGFVNDGKIGGMTLKSMYPSPESDSHDGGVGKNVDSFTKGSFPADAYNVEIRDEFVCEPSYEESDGETFAAFSRSLNAAYPGPAKTNVGECFSPHYNEAYVGHCNNELLVSGEHALVTHSSRDVVEMDVDDGQRNYYVDVDPIPIPGPPGSFLPSPGRMGSEELQGISSLTTCRIQSSEDEREVVGMGSLDSPISVMSVVSNSLAPISMQSHFLQTLPENNPTPEPEKNARNSSMGYGPCLVVSSNSDGRFTSHSDCDSPTKSTSNPVLRLMGKNLMVMNKDENPSPQSRLSTHCGMATIENQGPLFGVDNGLSTGNIHNEPQYFHRTLTGRPPSVPENLHNDMPAQYFDNCNLSNGFQVPSNFRPPQFPSKVFGGRFSSPLESREYANLRNLICNPLGSNIRRQDIRTAGYDDNIEKVQNCIPRLNSVDVLGSRQEEIIVINDSPERREGGSTVKATHGSSGLINNPFFGYDQTLGYPICASGSRDIQYRHTQMLFSKGGNTNLGKWINSPAECSTAVRPNSSTSASILPTTVTYLKPSLY